MKVKNQQFVIILENIRSAQNVGAIFRTAEAVGVDKIYLTGYTPAPFDRFGKKRNDISKAALGAEEIIPWESKKSITILINNLKKQNFEIVGLEQAKNSIDYKKFKIKSNVALILGNEVEGVSNTSLKKCDQVIEIPMNGKKESLNVSVAFGIATFRLLNK